MLERLATSLVWHRRTLGALLSAVLTSEGAELAAAVVEVDLTPGDVARQGYRVVKVAAPGLPFLQFGTLGAPRRHLRRLGLVPSDDIHPFA